MIKSDLYRYTNSGKNFLSAFLTIPGFRFTCLYRWCRHYSKINPLGIFCRLWFKRLQVKYGYQIPHTCKIGKGLFLGHYGNIVINQRVIIGNHCNIAQGVTLGFVSRGSLKGCPKIGDRVWIGANAVIVGNIVIGNDVLISPLSFVNFNVPDRAVVSGNPASIINYNSSEGYVKNIH